MEARSRKVSRCCVIGGGGFLGQHIATKLVQLGYQVNIFDMNISEDKGIVGTCFKGDLCKEKDLLPALEGVSVVFHCASPNPLGDNRELFLKVNVEGTSVILKACRTAGVKKLVLTSSASVVLEGKDVHYGDEEMPYATKPLDYYTESKILQEKLVLNADCPELLTCAIRPHGIFGPGDIHNVPTMVKAAEEGKTKYIIGDGQNIVDFTYAGNVADAHILAAEHLTEHSKVRAQAYNITNDEPVKFWSYITDTLIGLHYPAPRIHLPYTLLYMVALLMQFVCELLRPVRALTPPLTVSRVAIAGTYHYFSCDKAKLHFGYKPLVSYREALKLTIASFQHLSKDT